MLNYLCISRQVKDLNNEEIHDLFVETQNEEYLSYIIDKNRNSIFSIAANFLNALPANKRKTFDIQDLYHEGVIGYMVGLKKYDKSRKAKVNSACYFWSYYYVSKYFHKFSKIISYPDHLRKISKNVNIDELDTIENLSPLYKKLIVEYSYMIDEVDEFFDDKYNLIDDVGDEIENRYISFIVSKFTSEDKEMLDYELGKSSKPTKTEVIKRVYDAYKKIKKETLFSLPLVRNGEYLMSKYSYDMWKVGTCATEKDIYRNIDIYRLEKEIVGFMELPLPNGDVLLKTI